MLLARWFFGDMIPAILYIYPDVQDTIQYE